MANQKETNEQEQKDKAKADAKAELKQEQKDKAKADAKERDAKIKEIQKKKKRTEEDKAILKKEMLTRAKYNSTAKKDLNKMYPSQMTLGEMQEYCKNNEIKIKEGDTSVVIRIRIKAFRNPAQAERLRLLEKMPSQGKIIR